MSSESWIKHCRWIITCFDHIDVWTTYFILYFRSASNWIDKMLTNGWRWPFWIPENHNSCVCISCHFTTMRNFHLWTSKTILPYTVCQRAGGNIMLVPDTIYYLWAWLVADTTTPRYMGLLLVHNIYNYYGWTNISSCI